MEEDLILIHSVYQIRVTLMITRTYE